MAVHKSSAAQLSEGLIAMNHGEGSMRLILAFAALVVLGLFSYWFFAVRHNPSAEPPSNGAIDIARRSPSTSSSTSQGASADLPASRGMDAKNNSTARAGLGKFPLRQDVRELVSSADMSRFDYGMLWASVNCTVLADDPRTPFVRELMEKQTSGAQYNAIGKGTLAAREAAASQARQACQDVFGSGRLSGEEYAALRATDRFVEYRRIRDLLEKDAALTDPASRDAFASALKAPMFGTVYAQLLHLDTSPLQQAYPRQLIPGLTPLAATAIVCRMGDDCGSGGLSTLNLCWLQGICGADVEAALVGYFVERGLDPAPFQQYVGRIQGSLAAGNYSVFRSPRKS